jgi:acyl-CoA thioester hydrolase
MSDFKFLHPTEVRYGDLDPQGHVNNAKFLTYFEQARVHYLLQLGLFHKDRSFMEIGLIVADIHITYHAPVQWGDPIQTGVRTARIGGKSMTIEQVVVNGETGQVLAKGTVIMVGFDYTAQKSIRIPTEWRVKIQQFEGRVLEPGKAD